MAQTKYGVYFSKNGTTIRIPINPISDFPFEYPSDNTKYNVLGLGEVIVPRIPKLKKISWESFFPGQPDEAFVLTGAGFKPPEDYINKIKEYQEANEPVRFIVNRYMEDGRAIFDTNMEVIIEDFTHIEKGGETGDFYYRISLSEYRNFSPRRVTVGTPNASGAVTATATEQRTVPNNVITVGDMVIANGRYFYTSYGESPFGNANNTTVKVTRIIQNATNGQNYPVLIGNLGWVQMSQLRKA